MFLGLPWTDAVPLGPDAGALVVDPSPLLREALAARLRALGACEVEEAASLEGLTRTGADGELSARERDVLRLVADGYTNKEIGEKVDLSALTVKSPRARIARQLGTGDRAHMVAVGLRSGVIS